MAEQGAGSSKKADKVEEENSEKKAKMAVKVKYTDETKDCIERDGFYYNVTNEFDDQGNKKFICVPTPNVECSAFLLVSSEDESVGHEKNSNHSQTCNFKTRMHLSRRCDRQQVQIEQLTQRVEKLENKLNTDQAVKNNMIQILTATTGGSTRRYNLTHLNDSQLGWTATGYPQSPTGVRANETGIIIPDSFVLRQQVRARILGRAVGGDPLCLCFVSGPERTFLEFLN